MSRVRFNISRNEAIRLDIALKLYKSTLLNQLRLNTDESLAQGLLAAIQEVDNILFLIVDQIERSIK